MVKEAGGKINEIDCSIIKGVSVRTSSNSIYEKMLEKLNNF